MKSSFRSSALFLCGMVVAGSAIALGVLVFNSMASNESAKSISSHSNGDSTEGSAAAYTLISSGDAPSIETGLLALEGIEDYSDWSVALDEILASAIPLQLTAMLEQSRDIGNHNRRMAAQETIALRFAGIDPLHAMSSIKSFPSHQRSRLMETIVAEWSASDLDALVEHLKSFPLLEKESAFRTILLVRDDLSANRLREVGRRLYLLARTDDIIQSQRLTGIAGSIEETWYGTVGDRRPSREKENDLYGLAQDWIEREGVGVLSKIADSVPDWRTRRSVLHVALMQAARSDPQATFITALTLFKDTDWELIRRAAEVWMEMQPNEALVGISNISSSTLRRDVYEYVVQRWARREPRTVLELLDLLPEEMVDRVQYDAITSLREVTADEASRLMASVQEGGRLRRDAASGLVMQWASENFEEALEWILASPEVSEFRDGLFYSVLNSLTPANAQLTLRAALTLPAGDSEVGPEATVIYQVAQLDIDLAMSMVPLARNNRTLISAQVRIGEAYLDMGDPEQALEFANTVSENNRQYYYDGLVEVWTIMDMRGAFKMIERLPSAATRSRAAMWVLAANEFEESLSSDEIDELEAYLTDSDAESLANGNVQAMLPEE